jgi:hypothetical protein
MLTINNYKKLEEVDSNITINEYINQYNIYFYGKFLNLDMVIENRCIKFEILRNGIGEGLYEVRILIDGKCIGYIEIGMDVLRSLMSIKEWIYIKGKRSILYHR